MTPQGDIAGSSGGKTCFGIYKVEAGTLTLCLRMGGSDLRPTDFSTKPDDGRVVDVFRRESRMAGGRAQGPVKADLHKLQGKWF